MTTLTTNRFLSKALRILCCAGALTACSVWATVVTWQSSPGGASGSVGVTKDVPQSGYLINKAWGVDNKPFTDASHAFPFKTAPESGATSETSAGVAGILNNKPQASDTSAGLAGTLNNEPRASDTGIQLAPQSTLSQSGGQISARSAQPDESLLFAASNSPARSTTPLGGAIASAFDEEFVSVPTVQFASMALGSRDVSVTSADAATVVPLPEMSALFPIVGLIAAVSCTQILRRRRAAQQSASRSVV
ncbi:MAG TPA: hypothetical protein VF345_02210 [Chthoniobacterales bacterium]